MGIGGDIKRRKFLSVLERICNKYGLDLTGGGRHPYRVKCIQTNEVYPIPAGHKTINKRIVKDFGKWLERNNVCGFDEFERHCSSL